MRRLSLGAGPNRRAGIPCIHWINVFTGLMYSLDSVNSQNSLLAGRVTLRMVARPPPSSAPTSATLARRRLCPDLVLALAIAVSVALAVAVVVRSSGCHSAAKRRNLLLPLPLSALKAFALSALIREIRGSICVKPPPEAIPDASQLPSCPADKGNVAPTKQQETR